MSELKVRLYQASFNPSHPCRGPQHREFLLEEILQTMQVGVGQRK